MDFRRQRNQRFIKGYQAIVRPRLRRDIGIHNAHNMAIWPTLTEAIASCMNCADYYFSWRYGVNLAGIAWPPSVSLNDTDRHVKFFAYRFGRDRV